ncbi:c-type cytochrome [Citreimonas salinaria]|uniref:Cytochrome c, mono-and diheme variants n=1 Tax=Citreimonas salinaria TaxID=321339 RepID=A0A1H3P3U5_9RHOB|nr:cytochrome c [Citreimonas salinaria]SDY95824.1 Cytochrome c, mono-and diheme variants [Citreimonas salinaria]
MGPKAIGAALGVVATLLVAIAVWLTVAYTGAYNVAATDTHADAVRWTLDTTMRRSVASRAEDILLPGTVPQDMLAEGAQHYAASCAHCHGGPGVEPSEWSRGMRPEPPHLVEAAAEWEPKEIYWIAENGIKMSGMPAFGRHHGPEELLTIAAFVSQLPGMSPEDYATITSGDDGHGGNVAGSE